MEGRYIITFAVGEGGLPAVGVVLIFFASHLSGGLVSFL